MIKYIQQQKTETVIDDIICDLCGKSCAVYPYKESPYKEMRVIKQQIYMSLESHWGYGSGKDATYWKAQICEKCVDKKLKPMINFQIGSIVSVY
jgi:hypothetical protein